MVAMVLLTLYIYTQERVPVKGGRGTVHLLIKCKLCTRENSLGGEHTHCPCSLTHTHTHTEILEDQIKPYTVSAHLLCSCIYCIDRLWTVVPSRVQWHLIVVVWRSWPLTPGYVPLCVAMVIMYSSSQSGFRVRGESSVFNDVSLSDKVALNTLYIFEPP